MVMLIFLVIHCYYEPTENWHYIFITPLDYHLKNSKSCISHLVKDVKFGVGDHNLGVCHVSLKLGCEGLSIRVLKIFRVWCGSYKYDVCFNCFNPTTLLLNVVPLFLEAKKHRCPKRVPCYC